MEGVSCYKMFSASYMIRRCWVYCCLHVVKAHLLPIVFKTVFIRRAIVLHLTSKLCTVCITAWSSPKHSTADRQQFLYFIFHPYIRVQGHSIFSRKAARIIKDLVFIFLVIWTVDSFPGQQHLAAAVFIPLSNLTNDLNFLFWLFISTYTTLSSHN